MMLQSLLPIKLKKEESSYQSVEELHEVLAHAMQNKDIRNVALTGPFGSGKSSILQTLMNDFKEFEYLPISLATLQAEEDVEVLDEQSEEKEKRIENLNRKIEYSILQQLIYKEKAETVPNSRFRRIVHITKENLIKYSIGCVLFLLSFLIVFEPTFARVDTFYNLFDFGKYNVIFDMIATAYMLFAIYKMFVFFIRSYSNSKLNKLNLKDAEIEVVENNSIFNKHLDEILYFFQVTKYNVVIIEDLDRFGTSNIFLKLRELNQLINESKIVGRHVVFLYAVKDDVFVDEARTKFFDYIITVIPVINPSNSKDKLKAALKERGHDENEIPDDDLSEMAFFIQDMRILTNIANEYHQYYQKLIEKGNGKLNATKLLGMIVYKNYHPKDFAQLHRREGLVYKCISMKSEFVRSALFVLDEREKAVAGKRKLYEANLHLKEKDLRLLFLTELRTMVNERLTSISLDNNSYSLAQIAEDKLLFDVLLKQNQIVYYQYSDYQRRNLQSTANFDVQDLYKKLQFSQRIAMIDNDVERQIIAEEEEIQKESLHIQSLRLNVLINKYDLGLTDAYRNIRLAPLMDVFIRRGYIDEDYYDYISYFYEGMVSVADRELLLSIKRQILQNYSSHIDKIDNFVKELKDYMFEHDAILNIELLDYLARKKSAKGRTMYALMMNRIKRSEVPMDFLVQYYKNGNKQKEVFSDFINWDRNLTWEMFGNCDNNGNKQTLIEAWLRYCGKIDEPQKRWLVDNYSFLSSRTKAIGIERCMEIVDSSEYVFNQIDDSDRSLLLFVIEQKQYYLNTDNLCLITNVLGKNTNTTAENLNLTRITDTGDEKFVDYVKRHISDVIGCFSKTCKDESVENISFIINHDGLSSEQKKSYLTGEKNYVESIADIVDDAWEIAISSFVVRPTWKNVDLYYREKGHVDENLIEFVDHYHQDLEIKCDNDIESKQNLFKELLGTEKLCMDAYESIVKAFDERFDNYTDLDQLNNTRLLLLLNSDKIPFTSLNSSVLHKLPVYGDYLIYHSDEFMDNLEDAYISNVDVLLKLLRSDRFSNDEKRRIVNFITPELIADSKNLANTILDIVLITNNYSLEKDVLDSIIRTVQDGKKKILLLVNALSANRYSSDQISASLSLLGEKYVEIADRKKRPIIDDNELNRSLLLILKKVGYISSFSNVIGKGLRVNPCRI